MSKKQTKNKRIRKKHTKQQHIKKLSVKFSEKEINNFSVAEREKEYRKIVAQEKRKRTLEIKRKNNLKKLKSYGFKEDEIKKGWLTRNDNFIGDLIDKHLETTVFTAKQYLCVVYAEVNGHTIQYGTNSYNYYSLQRIIDLIHEKIEESEIDIDGSDDMCGIFQIYSGSKKACQQFAYSMSQRGYNVKIGKFTRNPYECLCIRNDWTLREFSEMILLVLSNCLNADRKNLLYDFLLYVEKNKLPFKDIFNDIRL